MRGLGFMSIIPFCIGRVFWVPTLIIGAAAAIAYAISKEKETKNKEEQAAKY